MPATVAATAGAFRTRLATISGLRTFAYQPEQINPPLAYPLLNTIEYHRAMGGGDVVMNWNVIVIVGRYTDSRAYTDLDEYLAYSGAKSIRATLESDRTLGGVVNTLVVPSAFQIQSLAQGDAEFLMIRVDCIVHG